MDHHCLSYAVPYSYRLLESTLEEIISFIKPVEEDRLKRENTINELRFLLQSVKSLKGATAKPFGSFVSNIYTKWGDLDISIELCNKTSGSVGRKNKQGLLRDIMKALRVTGLGHRFEFIPNARVPLLKFQSSSQNISCDISINNNVGPLKSNFLLWITRMDWRFSALVLLIKEWAKAHKINDPKLGTLNSYSLCLLVIFHLQTCEPAILPPLKEIFGFTSLCDVEGRGFINERYMEDTCTANIAAFKSSNKSSLSELLISFFKKFSDIQRLSFEYAICTYTGKWESKWSEDRWNEKSYALIIEDPFDRPDNAARAVGPKELDDISFAFTVTQGNIESASVLSQRVHLLRILVRPFIGEHLRINSGTQLQHNSIGTGQNDIHSRIETVVRLNVNQSYSSSRSFQNGNAKNMQGRSIWMPKHPDV